MKRRMSASKTCGRLRCPTQKRLQPNRRGGMLVLTAIVLVFLVSIVAFAVDLGYIATTKTELQSAADGAALAAAIELVDGLGINPINAQSQMQTVSKAAAVAVAQKNGNGNLSSTYLDSTSHMRFGQAIWNSSQNRWDKTWGATPANIVEVVTHRDAGASGQGDKSLDLFFAPIMGKTTSNLSTNAVAGVLPGVGFSIAPGKATKFGALPIACDETSWNALLAGTGSDSYSYNPNNGVVSSGGDGVKELNIYPDPNANLPSGNRGTVDLGNSNNSTNDLKRQILEGLNESDLSYFPNNTIRTDTGPVILNGDTGISAGIKANLDAIKGELRLMPIFTIVGSQQQATSGNMSGKKASGNNVYYRVIKFVGVRIVFAELTGNNKRVIIQPAAFSHSAVIAGKDPIATDSYFTKPHLIE
ncbi:MAG: hypothetical protein H7062_21645 [Candidatus Saccharimonas sp.]|nr:hypothetical protein [Planctomycetaceae bacterium]